ncbi:hypothetical protein [Nocardia sp. NPDC057353]|uniref:hypothetical protein n=1 Tax=Nocardia sp. NPDC057353 TaxID=3346104 RepID=UPI00362AFC33
MLVARNREPGQLLRQIAADFGISDQVEGGVAGHEYAKVAGAAGRGDQDQVGLSAVAMQRLRVDGHRLEVHVHHRARPPYRARRAAGAGTIARSARSVPVAVRTSTVPPASVIAVTALPVRMSRSAARRAAVLDALWRQPGWRARGCDAPA